MVARLNDGEFGKKSCTPSVFVGAGTKVDILLEG